MNWDNVSNAGTFNFSSSPNPYRVSRSTSVDGVNVILRRAEAIRQANDIVYSALFLIRICSTKIENKNDLCIGIYN